MATTTTIVGSGRYSFEVHEDWAKLPTPARTGPAGRGLRGIEKEG